MEQKVTAVYLLVWKHELTDADGGSYERPLARQKEKCLEFIREKGLDELQVVFYTSRSDLFRDVERDRVARIVMNDIGRLAATQEDLEGALFELKMRKIQILCVEESFGEGKQG
ncbi:MAG TPA: hypothetical protein VEF34_04880 [Syntrophobacteraceae bacterium]|nr:hypothetical protein [Syntrophobacteraceae bacterium]